MKWIKVGQDYPNPEDAGMYFVKIFNAGSSYPGVRMFTLGQWEVTEEYEQVDEWLDESESPSPQEQGFNMEERDNFAMSFAVFCLHNPDAQALQASGATAYQLLERYKSRPFINYDNPQNQ